MSKFYFVTYKTDCGDKVVRFYSIEEYFDWLQKFWNEFGSLPMGLSVFKGECIFDGS